MPGHASAIALPFRPDEARRLLAQAGFPHGRNFPPIDALFYQAAAVRGRISVVVTLTALYPLVTIMLARVFLAEPLSLRQGAGMALGLAAMMLMAG
jgi:hypothetical protein